MKVRAVNFSNMTSCKYKSVQNDSGNNQTAGENTASVRDIPYVYPLMFTAGEEKGAQAKLRRLFAYKLPCMYSGAIMIDPKELQRWINSGLYSKPASAVFEKLEPYKNSFSGMEYRLLKIIKERSVIHPDYNIKELLEEVEPIYKRRLRKSQSKVFYELRDAAEFLPAGCRYKFDELMKVTNKRLNERPIIIPFSSNEFKYRLYKINDYIQNGSDKKAKKLMKTIIKETKQFSPNTNEKTIANQQKVLRMIEAEVKKSVLKDEPRLNELIETSKSRLVREEIVVPFSRKQFLYDLNKALEGLPNRALKEKMSSVAEKLPTSNESFPAYVVKITAEPADRILYKLVWPYLASVEHLKPKSEGGERHAMANLGTARTILNSERKSRDFHVWITEHPQARENCQKYVDKLIQLYHKGVFKEAGINPEYIINFKKTIYTLSNQTLDLDISKM